MKYLVIFRWHQITKTLPQIRYLEILIPPYIKTPPLANYILRHVPTPPPPPPDIKTPPVIIYREMFQPPGY